MDTADMVRMANQIAGFFRAYPDAEALGEIRQHITAFWDPRMRQCLADHIRQGAADLDPLVVRAMVSGAETG